MEEKDTITIEFREGSQKIKHDGLVYNVDISKSLKYNHGMIAVFFAVFSVAFSISIIGIFWAVESYTEGLNVYNSSLSPIAVVCYALSVVVGLFVLIASKEEKAE